MDDQKKKKEIEGNKSKIKEGKNTKIILNNEK